MPDAILFDLDDTIILWETPSKAVWEVTIRRFAKELRNIKPEELYSAVSAVSDWYWSDPIRHRTGRLNLPAARREISQMAFERLGSTDKELAIKIADAFSETREAGSSIWPGTADMLRELRKRGIKLGLVTNGGPVTQRPKIEKYNLAPLFDHILIEGEFICGKPDKRVFLYTLEKLKVSPSSAWMVGDHPEFDIKPCNALGIYTVWVDNKGAGTRALNGICPHQVIHSISEIPGLL